jgi:hypothetical protein
LTMLDNFTNTNDHAVLAAKTASISQRLQEKLALEKHLDTLERAVVMRYIFATKLAQGEYQLASPLAKLDEALKEAAVALDAALDDIKARRAHPEPMTIEEGLALLQEADETAEDA